MNFVLVLSASGQAPEAIGAAIEFTRSRDAKLAVVFILDETVPAAIFDKLTDIGFIGEKPGIELESAVGAEYERQAQETLREIERLAGEEKVSVTTEMVQGGVVEKSLEAVAHHTADILIIARNRQTFLSRVLANSGTDELIRQAPCEIKVFES